MKSHHKAILSAPAPVDDGDKTSVFMGTDLSDTFYGHKGTDFMYGGQGSDRLYGASGKDVLDGGTGQDFLYGGNGADTFVYHSTGDAGDPNMSDVIGDFKSLDDHLDLHSFMGGGHFVGSAAFTVGGGPQVSYDAATGVLSGDVNGDGTADFTITMANHVNLVAADFIF